MASGGKGFLGFIGFWAFIIGFVLAIIAGLMWPGNTIIILVLVLLGIIVGLLNVTAKEFQLFLLATIALVVVGNVFTPLTLGGVGDKVGHILNYIAVLVSPAAIIAAIKALWAVGKPGD